MKNSTFNVARRHTLKLLAGTTAGLLTGMPAFSGLQETSAQYNPTGIPVDCTLISRADLARAYILMRNSSETEVIAAHFSDQTILFDNTLLNMADAYVEPIVIPPHDRVMVRLSLEAGLRQISAGGKVIDLNHRTTYLSQGTRVAALRVRFHHTAGLITDDVRLA